MFVAVDRRKMDRQSCIHYTKVLKLPTSPSKAEKRPARADEDQEDQTRISRAH